MRNVCALYVALVTSTLVANDMMNELHGEIHSTKSIRRVLPVRLHWYGREISLIRADAWLEWKPVDLGKSATLEKTDRNTLFWSWTISTAGGGSVCLSDAIISTDDGVAYETVEMNLPSLSSEFHDKPNVKDVEVHDSVSDAYRSEFEKILASCDVLVSARFPEAQSLKPKLMTFMEQQPIRSYLIRINFENKKPDSASWAIVRIIVTQDHFQADIIRAKEDDEIKEHTAYQAIPFFTVDRTSRRRRDLLDLDAIKFPSCRIEDTPRKP